MSLFALARGGPELLGPLERHIADGDTVGLFQLNGDLLDTSGNSYDLTEVGTVPYDTVANLNQICEAVMRPTDANHGSQADAAFQITGELTLICMLRMDASTGGSQTIVNQGGPAPATEINNILYWFYIDTSLRLNYLAESGAGSTTSFVGTGSLVRETWYHIALTRSAGGFVSLYIDGVLDSSGSTTTPTGGGSGDFSIGEGANAGDNLDGVIGSFVVKDVEMSAIDIAAEAARLTASWPTT